MGTFQVEEYTVFEASFVISNSVTSSDFNYDILSIYSDAYSNVDSSTVLIYTASSYIK